MFVLYAEPRGGKATFRWIKGWYKEYNPSTQISRSVVKPRLKSKLRFVYFRFVFQFYAVMVARWLISDNPSLLRLSNIGRGALHLQSACLKICECAPIFNLALCTYGGYRSCVRLNRSVVKPRLKSKLVSLIFVRKLRNISLFSGKCSQFLVILYQNPQFFNLL